MATNLLDLVKSQLSGDVVERIAGGIGENEMRTRAALDGALPAMLGGLVKSASNPEGAASLIGLLQENGVTPGRFSNPASALQGQDGLASLIGAGGPLLEKIFGARTTSVTDWLSSMAGIKKSSASSLLGLALPLLLGAMGRLLGNSWSPSGLATLLSDQKGVVDRSLPAGLAAALGFTGAARTGDTPLPSRREPPPTATPWWKWALPVVALLALIPFWRTCLREDSVRQAVKSTTLAPALPDPRVSATAVAPVRAELGQLFEKRLPDGIVLRIPRDGVESRLIAFIEDPVRRVDKDTWFHFDRLEFETDSSRLKPASQEQLKNIAEILKAYPDVNVKLGGYTDNVGDDAYNLKLSGERATSTLNELAALGIDRSRLAAEGYGEQFPVASNATEEGRLQNRRIDIRVTKK